MRRENFVRAVILGVLLSSAAHAQQPAIVSTSVAEKRVSELPKRPLFWRIENFPTPAEAQAASGAYSLVVEAEGKIWLFSVGPQGQQTLGGQKVAEVGPLAEVVATEYLLRVNKGSGSPGSITSVHTHPGSEAYYVMTGEASQKTPHGVSRITAGQSFAGHGADTAMQLINSGGINVSYFAVFVLDASKPFASPASFE